MLSPKAFHRLNHLASLCEFEILVGAKLVNESCWTEIICKNCTISNENMVRKVPGIRELFGSSKQSFSNSRHAPLTAEIRSIE